MALERMNEALEALARGGDRDDTLAGALQAIRDSTKVLAALDETSCWRVAGSLDAIFMTLADTRRMDAVRSVAEALATAGLEDPGVRLWLVQALIDQGQPALGLLAVRGLPPVTPPRGGADDEIRRASYLEGIRHGLEGRILKDLAVERGRGSEAGRLAASGAIEAYLRCGEERLGVDRAKARANARWAATNALSLRCWMGGMSPDDIDRGAVGILDIVEVEGTVPDRWDSAAAFEASLVRGDEGEATRYLERFLAAQPSAFELGGTLRQLNGILRSSDDRSDALTRKFADRVRLALLETPGGGFDVTAEGFDSLGAALRMRDRCAEAAYGSDVVTAEFLDGLLGKRAGVCRIDRGTYGSILATGFVVRGRDLDRTGRLPDEAMILTCSHAVASVGYHRRGYANILPGNAQVRFTSQPGSPTTDVFEVWHSPPDALDVTLLRIAHPALRDAARAWALDIDIDRYRDAEAAEVTEGGGRGHHFPRTTYVIGHPLGCEGVRFSLANNALLGYGRPPGFDASGWVLRYRTHTEMGSSGSPVLDGDQLKVVGLHHQGDVYTDLPGWPPIGMANEAVCLRSIAEAIRSGTLNGAIA
ncbi:S1 family peptidase [Methylobacterium sp. Leaf85]|uniref:S1 family peptidase n=1 Tax=Methylobacterium sp. Leaf85 TaxID=1736241 RepID=UPI0006F54994|nr:serine protease [Methylobacterium sp. Leaf85]KQO42528.1 hypothetical protein ASF08_13100 [Methylobacterium sp. Leaf85]